MPRREHEVKIVANMIGQRMSQAKIVLGRLLENRWKMGDWEGAAGGRQSFWWMGAGTPRERKRAV